MVPWQSSFPLQAHRICPSIRKVGGVFALNMGWGLRAVQVELPF